MFLDATYSDGQSRFGGTSCDNYLLYAANLGILCLEKPGS